MKDVETGHNNLTIVERASINLQSEAIEEWLSLLRFMAVTVIQDTFCVATIQIGGNKLQIKTQKSISSEDIAGLKKKFAEVETLHFEHIDTIINSQDENDYRFDMQNRIEASFFSPLINEDSEVAYVYIAGSQKTSFIEAQKFFRNPGLLDSLKNLLEIMSGRLDLFEALVDRIFDGVILIDMQKQILLINPAAIKLLDINNERNYVGQKITELGVDFVTDFLLEALENNLHEINKVVSSPKDKSKLIGIHTELLKNARNEQSCWMICLKDVTMNWQVDQMRSSLTIVSHEIKTPLNSILGSIDLLLDQDLGTLNQSQVHCLNIVKDDTARLNRLLTDILDLARFEEGVQFIDRRKQVALIFLVNKVIDSFKSYARSKNVTLISTIPKSIPTFRGDRDKLQQVFFNLVENSIKYSLPGGLVQIHADLNNSVLTLWIKDQGVGIPAAEHEAIFQKFKQLDNFDGQGERGYGLGLSITKEIIEALGGKIWVESEVGRGSTFYFTIPV